MGEGNLQYDGKWKQWGSKLVLNGEKIPLTQKEEESRRTEEGGVTMKLWRIGDYWTSHYKDLTFSTS